MVAVEGVGGSLDGAIEDHSGLHERRFVAIVVILGGALHVVKGTF